MLLSITAVLSNSVSRDVFACHFGPSDALVQGYSGDLWTRARVRKLTDAFTGQRYLLRAWRMAVAK